MVVVLAISVEVAVLLAVIVVTLFIAVIVKQPILILLVLIIVRCTGRCQSEHTRYTVIFTAYDMTPSHPTAS